MERFQQLSFIGCLLVTASLVLARTVHYSTTGLPTGLDRLVGHGIHYGISSSVLGLGLGAALPLLIALFVACLLFSLIPRKRYRALLAVALTAFVAVADGPESWDIVWRRLLVAAALTPLLLLARREWFLIWDGRRIRSAPLVHSTAWLSIIALNVLLDAEFFVFAVCATTGIMLWRAPWRRIGLDPASNDWRQLALVFVVWGLLSGIWWWTAPDPEIRRAVAIWAVALLFLVVAGTRWLVARDRLALALGFCALAQIAARVPANLDHGGVRLGSDGYAYTFCELPERNKLYATVPCDWPYFLTAPSAAMRDGCPYGYIAEHDLSDLESQTKHVFFDERFNGRLVRLACTPDTVQASMVKTEIDGSTYAENILEFQVDDPSQFEKALIGAEVGNCAVYDREHDALFYSSEHREHVFRLDRATGEVNRNIAAAMYGRSWEQSGYGSHHINAHGLHKGRDSIFVAQWAGGSKIFELSRSSLELLQVYDPMNGGNHGLAVDDDLDRLWATSPWGVEVLQIPTGETLARIRVGAATRIAAIDTSHDLVFVPSTFTGRLLVIDRQSMEVLGRLPIGAEGRHASVSKDGRRLYASNALGYFYWDIAQIARDLRDGGE